MKTKDLWIKRNECCGCELCAQTCPKHIIEMSPDEEGFLYPHILDDTDCINCNRCISVCPMKEPGRAPVQIKDSFCFSLPEEKDLKKSASGGVVTAVSREFIRRGGIVYGVVYSSDYLSVMFQRATTVEELEAFRGSKYVQANKREVYADIKNNLKAGKQVLFVGLPCEVSAVYHAVPDATNLYTISLICHGPTSQKVHSDYCESLPNSDSGMTGFSVRYKKTGWKPYYIHAEYADGTIHEERWNTSDYGIAFQYLKRPSCLSCRYKSKDNQFGLQSDMTVGDYHALKKTA
jgi:Coenzyme F420-reducing hydrogenase, beta subunit